MQLADAEFSAAGVRTGIMMAAVDDFNMELDRKLKEMEWKIQKIYEPAGWVRFARNGECDPYLLAKQY